jgi:hypothetical protein
MKIEFLKEVTASGEITYYTRVDNVYCRGSVFTEYDRAKECFDRIKENPFNSSEIIESYVI